MGTSVALISPIRRIPPFAKWTPSIVQGLLHEENDELVQANAKFMAGEHWQEGKGWIGPSPSEGEEGFNTARDLLKRGFTSRNVILEVARRHSEGVVGNEPDWGLLPNRLMREDEKATKEEQDLIDEAEASLVNWWDDHLVLDELAQAVEQTTWARRGTLRMFIPAGLLGDPVAGRVTLPTVTTLADALRFIYVESIDHDQGMVYTDWRTKRQAGAVLFQDERGQQVLETCFLKDPLNLNSPATIMTVGNRPGTLSSQDYDLGGRLPMFELRQRRLLISRQVQESQRAMNLSLSVMPRNIVSAGFLERVFLNAQMPGTWEVNEAGVRVKFVPAPYKTGANTTNWVQGQELVDPLTGDVKQIGQPQAVFREPVPVDSSVKAKGSQYEDILEEVDQVHVLVEGSATPSGVSRQEARAGYERSLRRTRRPSQKAGLWILMTALEMAQFLMRKPKKYTGPLRAHFDCRLDTGPISPDDQRVAGELAEKGVISEPTAMVRVGVQDPDAEIARRNATPEGRLVLRKKQLETLDAGTKIPGSTLEGVAEFIGLQPGEAAMITKGAPEADLGPDGNPVQPPDPTQANNVPGIPAGPIQQ